jgi:hypothetical protein
MCGAATKHKTSRLIYRHIFDVTLCTLYKALGRDKLIAIPTVTSAVVRAALQPVSYDGVGDAWDSIARRRQIDVVGVSVCGMIYWTRHAYAVVD